MSKQNEEKAQEQAQEQTQEQAQEPKKETPVLPDPYEEVVISTARAGVKEDPNIQVGINGVTYLVPKGKSGIKVPRCVAEEIARSEQARDEFDRGARKRQEDAAKVQTPEGE